MSKIHPTPEALRELLDYDPATGVLTWRPRQACKNRAWNARHAGKEAGRTMRTGYRRVKIDNVGFAAHRVIWAIHYGSWPELQIDHINGDKADNRICNLRDVPNCINSRNIRLSRISQSGTVGIHRHRKRWAVKIGTLFVGSYIDMHDAQIARAAVEVVLSYGPSHGFDGGRSSARRLGGELSVSWPDSFFHNGVDSRD